MIKSSKTWWDRFLFRDRGIVPTKKLMILYGILVIPILIITSLYPNWLAFIVVNVMVLAISLIDVLLLPRRKALTLRRTEGLEIERGATVTIDMAISNRSKRPIRFSLIDHLPDTFTRPFPIQGELAGETTTIIKYPTKAAVRGDYSLGETSLRYRSLLGLWEKQMLFSLPTSIKVIPDMTSMREAISTAAPLLTHEGHRPKRNRRGSGEFSQVRSFVIGDDPRKINWRQSAKAMALMTNVHEPEHGKHIALLLDCGRTMGVELKETNRLERSLEALLTVSAVALKQGDRVSVVAFSNQIKAYVPPGKGIDHFHTIVEELYDLHSDQNETNLATAFTFFNQRQRRRSLIMLFSDLDAFLYDEMAWASFELLKRRHFTLILSLADPILADVAGQSPESPEHALMIAAAERELIKRRQAMRRWRSIGGALTEVPEEQLAASALSRYIDIMNREVI